MFLLKLTSRHTRLGIVPTVLVLVLSASFAYGQTEETTAQMKQQVGALLNQQKYTEALPLLEKLTLAEPDNAETQFYLGFALIAQSKNTEDQAARVALRLRARKAFVRSKELGNTEQLDEAMIESIPLDGSEPAFSGNAEVNRLMNEAEAAFSAGQMDVALQKYQAAFKLDPKNYEAALFSGDVYSQTGNFDQAEVWYQKAIAIDPTRETAYRYFATPLMKQEKYDLARDRYIEAYITEPYSRTSFSGLVGYATARNLQIGHPKIDIPTDVTFDEKGDIKINLDASLLLAGHDDGSFAWIAYGATRKEWHSGKFAKTFPKETAYRHSLPEEADALRSVLRLATTDKKVKQLSPALMKLKKLDDEGMLESYILLARADEGLSHDHPAYLAANRDKLRKYMIAYVFANGQN
jgi:tetratricopeptide (TPR) repeat protein